MTLYVTLESENRDYRVKVPVTLMNEFAAWKAEQEQQGEDEYDPTAERLKKMCGRRGD